jgi:copper chaperone CopZ
MRLRYAALGTILMMLVGNGLTPAAVGAQNNAPKTVTSTLRVPDMFCGGCEVAVKIAAKKVDGVMDVNTDSAKRTADVTYDPSKTNATAIAGAITKNSGLKAEVVKKAKS